MVYPITIQTVEDAQTVCKVACEQDFNIYVSSGTIIVDARSLLGLFALLGCKSNLVAPDSVDYRCFVKTIKRMNLS
jgi:hypothetical protein